MKPLVFYCRWQGASLRLRGRDDTAVWGELVYKDKADNETAKEFKFNLKTWELTLLKEGTEDNVLKLDEKGVVLA